MDFTNNIPKIMTYFNPKGLTFDTILMPRLVSSSFFQVEESPLARLLFAGISRATTWVYSSSCQGQENPALNRLKPLAEAKKLNIQIGSIIPGREAETTTREEAEKTDDGGILDLL
jgi:hypothetical protein